MRLPTIPTISNPYLLSLIPGERDLRWLSIFLNWPILWVISCALIWARLLEPSLDSFAEAIAFIGLPVSILGIAIFLMSLVSIGAKLTFTEDHNEQFALLRLTNTSHDAIFWSLVLATTYRVRFWLIWIIGGCPYLLWFICQGYWIWALPSDLRCFISPLSHGYCYSDGAPDSMRLLELFWFMSITIAIACLCFLAILCAVGLTLKSKNALLSGMSVLAFILPVVLGLILIGTPEGFLYADTAYGRVAANEAFGNMIPVGIVIAILPFIVLLGTQHFLRKWAFK
ncbi:MAG: hypothetical protein ABI690_25435 [Chloroflexota bacterium]